MVTEEPAPTSSTWLNSTLAPWSASSFSIRTTAPSWTRYCLPPVAITAYMVDNSSWANPKRPQKSRELYGGEPGRSNWLFGGSARRTSHTILRYHDEFD